MTGRLSDNYFNGLRFPTNPRITSGGRSAVALSSLYSHGSYGTAVAIRYQSQSAAFVDELYVFMDVVAGTLANIQLTCRVYGEHATSATQPGSSWRTMEAVAVMPSAAKMWVKFVFPQVYTPSLGEVMWFVIYPTYSSPGTDTASILGSFNVTSTSASMIMANVGYSTINGFSTAGTAQTRMPFVIRQSGKSIGWSETLLNGTVLGATVSLKGFQFTPRVDVEVIGWQTAIPNGNMTHVRIYDNNTPPIGTPLLNVNLGTTGGQTRDEIIGAKIWSPIILYGGTTYNVVTAWSAANGLGGSTIEDYASYPAIFDDLVDGMVQCFPVQAIGSDTWALTRNGFINQQLIISDFPPPAVSGATRRPKVWNGVAWQEKPVGVWNGTTWEEQPFKVWDGSAWIAK